MTILKIVGGLVVLLPLVFAWAWASGRVVERRPFLGLLVFLALAPVTIAALTGYSVLVS